MSTLLVLKLILVPILIGGITLAGRRWGPGVAGWLSAFPVVTGPILLFIAIEQGNTFTEIAAKSTLSAVMAIVIFGLSYSWMAMRFSWGGCIFGSFICYAFAVLLLNAFALSLPLSILLVLATLLIAQRLFPDISLAHYPAPSSYIDMFLRMCAGAALVFLVTHFSAKLGARLSGLLAMFPVMASVLAVFTHRQSGNAAAIHLLRGTIFGYYAFASFCLMLVLLLPKFSVAISFLCAFGIAGTIQMISRRYLQPHSVKH